MNPARKKYIVSMICYLAMMVLCEGLRLMFTYGVFDGIEGDELFDFAWSLLSQIVCMAGIPLVLLFLLERSKRFRAPDGERVHIGETVRELGVCKTKWWVYLVAIGIGFTIFFSTIGVSFINQIILLMTGYRLPASAPMETGGVGMFFLTLFGTAVLPGVCEEIMHRGILVRGLRGKMRDGSIILLTAFMFSMMHTYILQTVFTFFAGLVLGTLVVKTRSIFPAMIVHFMNNGISTYAQYAEANGWFGSSIMTGIQDMVVDNLVLAGFLWLLAVAATVALVWVVVKFAGKKDDYKREPLSGFYRATDPLTGAPALIPFKYDPLTGEKVDPDNVYRKIRGVDYVWLATALFMGILFTFFTLYSGLL